VDPLRTLDYTVVICRDLPRAVAFYRDVLGLPIATQRERWVEFRMGSTILALRSRGAAPWGDDGPPAAGSAAVQLAFRVAPPAVDGWHANLVAKGVRILRGPTDLPEWRHRTLFFADPEDNVLEIYAEY
jgi:glyoxylase I family protein